MTALINAIRQALDAGPTAWEYDSNQTPFYNDSDGHSCGGDSDGTYSIYGPGFTIENEMYEGQVLSERCNETDAKYISACNPAAITELLAELDSLKIDAAIVTKIGNPLLSDYVEKAIMDDRKKWCKLIGKPFLIVTDLQGFPLSLYKLPDQITKELK